MITLELEHFDLEQICGSGQCFRMKRIGENRYSVIAADQYLEIEQQGKIVTFCCSQEVFLCFWLFYFDLDCDYQEYMNRINPRDKYLNAAAEKGSGIRILQQDLWEMIVSFLISQQNNIVRIRKCIENICERYGEKKLSFEGKEYYAFPTPERLSAASEKELRECNLGYRAKYVLEAAKAVSEERFSLEKVQDMTYRKAKTALRELYGVGEKVADCICLFALHHTDAFPVDTHIKQALEKHYKRGFPNRRYKGIRGIMQQYIFYYELNGAK